MTNPHVYLVFWAPVLTVFKVFSTSPTSPTCPQKSRQIVSSQASNDWCPTDYLPQSLFFSFIVFAWCCIWCFLWAHAFKLVRWPVTLSPFFVLLCEDGPTHTPLESHRKTQVVKVVGCKQSKCTGYPTQFQGPAQQLVSILKWQYRCKHTYIGFQGA